MKSVIPHPQSRFWHNTIRLIWMLFTGASALSLADHIGHYDIVAHVCLLDHGVFGFVGVSISLIFAALYFGFEKGENPSWWQRLWRHLQ